MSLIIDTLDQFHTAMQERLEQKGKDGFAGWNEETMYSEFEDVIFQRAEAQRDIVDFDKQKHFWHIIVLHCKYLIVVFHLVNMYPYHPVK